MTLLAQGVVLVARVGALVTQVGALVAQVGALVVQERAPEYQRNDNKALLDAALVLLDGGLLLSVVDPVLLVACLISLAAALALLTSRHECREAHNSFEIHAVLGSSFGVQFSKRKSDERTLPPLHFALERRWTGKSAGSSAPNTSRATPQRRRKAHREQS